MFVGSDLISHKELKLEALLHWFPFSFKIFAKVQVSKRTSKNW